MQTTHKIFAAALLAAGALAIPSHPAAAGGWGWDAGCGCQRPIAYVQPVYVAPPPQVVTVYRPRVVYQPRVVYEATPAVVVHAPVSYGCCGGGIFGGYYGHYHGYYGGGYGGFYGGYGHVAHYGYGPTD